MISVIIAADSREKKFRGALQNILGRNFSALQYIGGCVDARSENAELFITDALNIDFIYSGKSIFVFKDFTRIDTVFESDGEKLAIVDSCDKDAMRIVSETKLPAITCGLSPCDTLTLSSMSDESAVISLQRCITCFDNTVAEPQEIPISLFAQAGSFALLCAAAIFILTGNINKLSMVKL